MRPFSFVSQASFAALVLLAFAESAPACTCMLPQPFSYAAHSLRYDRVFHGEVEANEVESSGWRRRMRFRILKDYSPAFRIMRKGDSLAVWTSVSEASCGVSYPVGSQVLVFASFQAQSGGDYRLETTLCSLNAGPPRLESALAELEASTGLRDGGQSRSPRRKQGGFAGGQVLFGEAKANGARSATPAR